MSIYLDNSATTKPLCDIADVYKEYAEGQWYNPSALYSPAVKENIRLDEARKSVLKLFSNNYNVLFTSSGTEGANTVILGGARRKKNMHYITDIVEHPAVYETFKRLKENGADITVIDSDKYGRICPDDVADAVREDTAMVSIMHVNNETGAVNDIETISALVKEKNSDVMFHADGVQAFGRVFVKCFDNIDYYTVSAHKIHALKGTGAVFYKKGLFLKPFIVGGGQESGLRSGTENTFGIYAFKTACDYYWKNRKEVSEKLNTLKTAFLSVIDLNDMISIISPEDGASHIICLSVKNVRGEVLLHSLEEDGVYISTGSACSSKKGVSRTAKSLGLSKEVAEGIVRISFSPFNTVEEVSFAAKKIIERTEMLSAFIRK